MKMKVVNKHNHGKLNIVSDLYIGRPSLLGNPFSIQEFGRDECVRLYKIHFDYMIKHSKEFRELVGSAMSYENLVCWCAPEKCHGDIIRDYIIEYRKKHVLIT